MKFAPMFSDKALKNIYETILDYSSGDAGTCRLTISDSNMCRILEEDGYAVSVAFVQRARQKLDIKARGSCPCKYTGDDLKAIQEIICGCASLDKEAWKLTVSDAEMSRMLNECGYQVNVKYVERARKSLGIESLGKRGGFREGAGRPSISGATQDIQYAKLICQHNQAAMQLSYYRRSSGALLGQTGADVHDRFGQHTTDPEDAIRRKDRKLKGKRAGSDLHVKSRQTKPNILATLENNHGEIEEVITEQINHYADSYGKVGKGGGVGNNRAVQVFTSI